MLVVTVLMMVVMMVIVMELMSIVVVDVVSVLELAVDVTICLKQYLQTSSEKGPVLDT